MRFQDIIINILTSGKSFSYRTYKEEKMHEHGFSGYLIKYVVMNFIHIFGSVVLIVFIFQNLAKESYFDAFACSFMSIVAFLGFIISRTKVTQIVPAVISTISFGFFCVLLVWNGDAHGAGFLFIFLYPMLTVMLLGMTTGVAFSSVLLVIIIIEFIVPGASRFYYHLDVSLRMIAVYILILGITLVYETSRKTKDKINEKLTQRIRGLKEKAEAASKAKGDFLANMSHEIRTPMNAITGMSELILRKDLPEDVRIYAQDIKHAATSLISIINDILDFSKIEAGKLEIIPAKYKLSSLVGDTVNIIRMRLIEKPIQFCSNIDMNIPNNLFGDEVRLRQIILNLLSNAVKFTNEGNIRMVMNIDRQVGNKIFLRITISDTGQGIKAEDQERLFTDFMQVDTKRNRNIEGTGLGLAITKQLCVAMGGDINVKSEYGVGSEFTVIVPQDIDPDEPLALVGDFDNKKDCFDSSAARSLVRFTIPTARVLVVDDIETNLMVAEGLLEYYEAIVDTCMSGAEAIELVKQHAMHSEDYDLVFMDHMMPDMDGIETTLAIRAWEKEQQESRLLLERPKGVPIVALTANAVVGMREMFIEKGFSDFLTKPIDVSKLEEMLERWIPEEKRAESK